MRFYVHAVSWQCCSFTGGAAVPSHEAWRQQDISAHRGHVRLMTWPLTSPAVRAFTSLWSSVEPAGFLFYQCWSVKGLMVAVIKGNHLVSVTCWLVNNDEQSFFSFVFLTHLRSYLLRPPCSTVRRHFNPHCHPDSKWMVFDQEDVWSAVERKLG